MSDLLLGKSVVGRGKLVLEGVNGGHLLRDLQLVVMKILLKGGHMIHSLGKSGRLLDEVFLRHLKLLLHSGHSLTSLFESLFEVVSLTRDLLEGRLLLISGSFQLGVARTQTRHHNIVCFMRRTGLGKFSRQLLSLLRECDLLGFEALHGGVGCFQLLPDVLKLLLEVFHFDFIGRRASDETVGHLGVDLVEFILVSLVLSRHLLLLGGVCLFQCLHLLLQLRDFGLGLGKRLRPRINERGAGVVVIGHMHRISELLQSNLLFGRLLEGVLSLFHLPVKGILEGLDRFFALMHHTSAAFLLHGQLASDLSHLVLEFLLEGGEFAVLALHILLLGLESLEILLDLAHLSLHLSLGVNSLVAVSHGFLKFSLECLLSVKNSFGFHLVFLDVGRHLFILIFEFVHLLLEGLEFLVSLCDQTFVLLVKTTDLHLQLHDGRFLFLQSFLNEFDRTFSVRLRLEQFRLKVVFLVSQLFLERLHLAL